MSDTPTTLAGLLRAIREADPEPIEPEVHPTVHWRKCLCCYGVSDFAKIGEGAPPILHQRTCEWKKRDTALSAAERGAEAMVAEIAAMLAAKREEARTSVVEESENARGYVAGLEFALGVLRGTAPEGIKPTGGVSPYDPKVMDIEAAQDAAGEKWAAEHQSLEEKE